MSRWMWSLVAVMGLWMPARGEPLASGKWLTDLGRDYPLSPQAFLSDADAELTLLFMQAAARIEPQLAEAYLWQYDMLTALGRDAEARKALAEYVRRQPADVAAHLDWVALTCDSRQTAEERAAFCRSYLQRESPPDEVASDLHRRLADFHFNRGEAARAQAEAEAALGRCELNFAARMLLDEIANGSATAGGRIQTLLSILAMSPGSADHAWRLGDELRLLGMASEAGRWYEHAAAVFALMPPGTEPPGLLAARSQALIDGGRIDEADALAGRAIELDPDTIEAHLARARIAEKRGQPGAARENTARASDVWRSVLSRSRGKLDPVVLAEMAWFFVHADPHPTEAEKLARLALAERPDSVAARRALGAALGQLERFDEALKTLEPIADSDAWAVIELARALHDAGRQQQAVQRLRTATQPAGGEYHDAVVRLAEQWQVNVPASQPAPAEIQAMLNAFPSEVLDYPVNPGKYLSLRLSVPRAKLPPGEPWRCTIELRNIGPFPITFGGRMMLVPDLLCAIETRGDRVRSSGPTIRISLNRTTRLMPGELVQVTQTLDVGPIRSSMIGTPQVGHDVQVSAVINPIALTSVDGQELWTAGVGGVAAEPLHFHRSAIVASRDEVGELIRRSRAGAVQDRIAATQLLAMLFAEHQHLAAGRLGYAARRIDADAVRAALLARARDPEWHVRARLAECMRWFVLDKGARQAATDLLADPHWLVRGLTLRMFADHDREKFTRVLQAYARADSDEWVQRLARTLLDRMSPTTQPARTPRTP